MIVCRSFSLSGEVPERVGRQVDDRRLVRGGGEVDSKRALGERIGGLDLERSRVAHLAVNAGVAEDDAAGRRGHDLPDLLVEAARAAVKGVSAVVSRELIGPSVEREAAAADAVGKAADDRAEVMARLARVTVEIGESEHDVRTPAFPVG